MLKDTKTESPQNLSQRWCIRLGIEGDLRFCSHREILRALQWLASRANVRALYTQGFNPHPILALASPRPAGVASRDDLLVIRLDDSAGVMEAADLLGRLNVHAPRGMRFFSAVELPGRRCPQPRRNHYELAVPPERIDSLRRRLEELAAAESWPFDRPVPARRRGRGQRIRHIDLRPLVAELALAANMLHIVLVPNGDLWARPGEVLALIGLGEGDHLAALVRTSVEYDLPVNGEAPRETIETS